MIGFLKANGVTIIVLLVLVLIVALIIRKLVKDKKSGKSACGCDCSTCGGACHCCENKDKSNPGNL